mgnify:CR=1 FL=1
MQDGVDRLCDGRAREGGHASNVNVLIYCGVCDEADSVLCSSCRVYINREVACGVPGY